MAEGEVGDDPLLVVPVVLREQDLVKDRVADGLPIAKRVKGSELVVDPKGSNYHC